MITIRLSNKSRAVLQNLAARAVEPIGRCGAVIALKAADSSRESFRVGNKGTPESGYKDKWADWKPSTRKAYEGSGIAKRRAKRMGVKAKGRTSITHSLMYLTGALAGGIVSRYAVTGKTTAKVEVGLTGRVADYGVAHQFGNPKGNLVARPFIGITPKSVEEIKVYVQKTIGDAIKGKR